MRIVEKERNSARRELWTTAVWGVLFFIMFEHLSGTTGFKHLSSLFLARGKK